jgi:phosphopantetheinyl transferase (holo-ACP synthase)
MWNYYSWSTQKKTASGHNGSTRSKLSKNLHTWRNLILLHIGNDIVDLTDPHNKGKSRNLRFVNRVFTLSEQKQIFNSTTPDTITWALWAGKETAYKIISKCHPSASSTPRLYEVLLDWNDISHEPVECFGEDCVISGTVDTPYGHIHIRIFVTPEYVHCVGATVPLETTDAVVWHVDRIRSVSEASPANESLCVREALKKHLSAYVDENPEGIEIRREKGSHGLQPPFVYLHGRRNDTDISLSHDGMFTAYAFTILEDSRTYAVENSRSTSR